MSLEHLLPSRYPSVEPTNPESIKNLKDLTARVEGLWFRDAGIKVMVRVHGCVVPGGVARCWSEVGPPSPYFKNV